MFSDLFCSVFANNVEKWTIFQKHKNCVPGIKKMWSLHFEENQNFVTYILSVISFKRFSMR